ncbi:amino acid permease [Nocardioides sp. Root151]|uniref:amino acid permease n=1 Tax=Nocardioides sp. Root151 TaxID=1736475 RepID=UPI0009E87888|nr:amino acid permease [Nocardioides sp. Root151]
MTRHTSPGRRLPAEVAIHRVDAGRHRLPRVFGTAHLVMLGLGVMIGAGIFGLAGQQAATAAGPAVIISFGIASLVCLLAAFSYAELSSTIPAAGSVYTFSYVAIGEVWAWLVGWALVLELVVAAALVGRFWATYFVATLDGFGLEIPAWLGEHASADTGTNWVAFVAVAVIGLLVVTGTKLSARVLTWVVAAKLAVIGFVIAVGAAYVTPGNYTPFVPQGREAEATDGPRTVLQMLVGSTEQFGAVGVFSAAGVIVFAYIGFDLIATAAEDAHEPRRSIPRSMMISLAIVTLLYVAMAVVLVGLRPSAELGSPAPVSDALEAVGVGWAAQVVNLGALLALTTVIMVVLIAQSRVLFAMGRDGLLPPSLGRVSPTFLAPSTAALVAGSIAAVLALWPGLFQLEQLLVIGALFSFLFCALAVIVLRRTQPDLERGFRVPMMPLLPVLSATATGWLMLNLTGETWRNFAIWMAGGLVLYVAYGRRHSHLASTHEPRTLQGSHRR